LPTGLQAFNEVSLANTPVHLFEDPHGLLVISACAFPHRPDFEGLGEFQVEPTTRHLSHMPTGVAFESERDGAPYGIDHTPPSAGYRQFVNNQYTDLAVCFNRIILTTGMFMANSCLPARPTRGVDGAAPAELAARDD
jgi:hypothetical protein